MSVFIIIISLRVLIVFTELFEIYPQWAKHRYTNASFLELHLSMLTMLRRDTEVRVPWVLLVGPLLVGPLLVGPLLVEP